MPQVTSNLSKTNALNSKINPNPLGNFNTPAGAFSLLKPQQSSSYNYASSLINPGSQQASSGADLSKYSFSNNQVSQSVINPSLGPTQPSTQTPTYRPPTTGSQPQTNSTYTPPAQGQTTQPQIQPPQTQAQPTGPQFGGGLYGQLLQDTYQKQNEAAGINQALNQGLNDITKKPIALEFQQGQQGALQRDYGVQAQAATQRATNAATLAGLAKPELSQYGQTYYQPGSDQSSAGGAGVSPSDPFYQTLQSYAQMAASGQTGAIPASITGNAVLNAQLQQLAKQYNPGYNFNTAQGTAAAQQQQGAQASGYQSALQQGQNLQSQLTDLIRTFNLNPSDVNAANVALQRIASNTSSPQYQQLANYINDVANTYAQILTPSGGSQTDSTRAIARSMLDATASGQSLVQVMQGLDQAARAKIAGVSTAGSSSGGSGGQFSGAAWR